AIAQIDDQNFEGARRNLERAAEMAGRTRKAAPIYNNLSLVMFNLGDTERAIELAKLTIELDPGLPEAYNNRGIYHASRREYP
ncbi:tetratricopeptide repeat protein, partial [Acinetobacter baumannii]